MPDLVLSPNQSQGAPHLSWKVPLRNDDNGPTSDNPATHGQMKAVADGRKAERTRIHEGFVKLDI